MNSANAVERRDTPSTSADIGGSNVTYVACTAIYGRCANVTVAEIGSLTEIQVTSGQENAKVVERQDIVWQNADTCQRWTPQKTSYGIDTKSSPLLSFVIHVSCMRKFNWARNTTTEKP